MPLLLNKRQAYGEAGSLRGWFKNYLEDRQQRVVVDGIASTTYQVSNPLEIFQHFLLMRPSYIGKFRHQQMWQTCTNLSRAFVTRVSMIILVLKQRSAGFYGVTRKQNPLMYCLII